METGTRRVNLNKFITYIEKNYRSNLNKDDYEILNIIANNYSTDEVMKAINYCKSNKTDSLIYLQKALANKYYQSSTEIEPEWMKKSFKFKKEKLGEEDKKYMRDFYKRYCTSEAESNLRIQEMEELNL